MSFAKAQPFYRLNSEPQWGSVTPLAQATPWLRSSLRKVTELALLPSGWDGYGSRPIQQPAVERVSEVLTYLSYLDLPNPQLFPVPGGGIQIEMRQDDRELEIEILPDGSIEYLLVLSNGEMSEGAIPSTSIGDLLCLVYRFQGNLATVPQ
jgi:hypothetical protein